MRIPKPTANAHFRPGAARSTSRRDHREVPLIYFSLPAEFGMKKREKVSIPSSAVGSPRGLASSRQQFASIRWEESRELSDVVPSILRRTRELDAALG